MKTLLKPLEQFLQSEAKGGFILFGCAVVAIIIANSPLAGGYFSLKELPISLNVGDWQLAKPLASWVKDLLMSFFFLLVGLEIKREIVQGELSNPRRAALTIVAAIGGMLVPALIYMLFNRGTEGIRGWGIPMATDIAFALGVLSLLGKRVPLGLKVFLTAFAIVDDLGAILVIAFFYTSSLNLSALALAGLFFVIAFTLGRLKVDSLFAYLIVGAFMWYFTLQSGISPTVAAVMLAVTLPLTPRRMSPDLDALPTAQAQSKRDSEQRAAELQHVEESAEDAQSPLHRLEHHLHPWAAYFILPIFAFMNAGVALSGAEFGSVALGVFLGLLLGKPVGIFLLCYLAVQLKIAALPEGVNWLMILGAGFLGGIGFTMSLFVAGLAFPGSEFLDQAKLGVLSSSVVSAIIGLTIISRGLASDKQVISVQSQTQR
jgi:Na+:H+ antiporter, NhaA family